MVLSLLAALCPSALALNPSLDINQYAHTAWTIRDGFFKSVIYTIAQTPDGYLWLGTGSGLLRFDGVRAVPWTPPGSRDLSDTAIRSLLATRDGTLWIGTDAGLASWTGAKLTRHPELNPYRVEALFEDRAGTVWAGGRAVPNGILCAIHSGNVQCFGQDGSLGDVVVSIYEDSKGALWAGAASGLWRWKPGAPVRSFVLDPKMRFTMNGINEAFDGQIIVAGREGLVNSKGKPYPILGTKPAIPEGLLRDRDGALWLGTGGAGLWHLHPGRTDVFSRSDGLSSDSIFAIFEDREGNIWVSTSAGLDRFREFAIPTVSPEQGLPGIAWSVLAGRDGSIWMGGTEGLNRWKDGNVTVLRKASGLTDDGTQSLFQDDAGRILVSTRRGLVSFENGRFTPPIGVPGTQRYVFASGGPGNLWISGNESLVRLVENRVVEAIPWSQLGAKEAALAMIRGAEPGGIWLGFRLGRGVIYLQDGQIRQSYRAADGLGAGAVYGLKLDHDGALWAATASGLSLIRHERVTTFTSKNGLPCNTIHLVMDDDDRSTWLYTACGLVRLQKAELEAWKTDPRRTVHTTVFDNSDGVLIRSTLAGGYTPRITKSPDGKLWFVPGNGAVSVIDPRHLAVNKLPPPVHIEQIIADRKPVSNLRLPALTRDLEIQYTALSLVAPEKNRFKYKLEGYDRDWQDAGTRRQVFYNDLPPRQYRFRAIASNNSGVWNETGDTLEFSIAPAYYQTNWFRALLAATFLALMWAAYQFRVRLLQRESRQLREVIDTIPASAWSAGPDGSVEFINERWLEFGGFSSENGLGWGWETAVHPQDRDRFLAQWRAALASGKPMEAEARLRRTDGQYRWLLIRNVPLRAKNGKIVKWYGTSTDIEDLKRAGEEREKLRQLEAELAHINRVSMMGELAASVAHEVNQPLTGIVSNGGACLRWLAGDAPNVEEAREGLRDIVRDGKRAGEVIARIRALTKRTALPKEIMDVNETIREVLALVGDQAKKNSVTIRTRFADDAWPVLADRVQLQQVLLNLVMNAMEAMSSVGDRERQLLIVTRNVEPAQVQVTVEDSGTGLDPSIMSRIFDPFYTTKSGGMGMGLSISRSIIQNHGGRLWATANDGPGTSFHFTIPKYHEEEGNAGARSV